MIYAIPIAVALAVASIVLAVGAERSRIRKNQALDIASRIGGGNASAGAKANQISKLRQRFRSFEQIGYRRFRPLVWIDDRLFLANIRIGVISLGLGMLAFAMVTFALQLAFAFPVVPAALLSFLIPPLVFWQIVERRVTRRNQEFEAQIPEFLLLMSSSLNSGLSFLQSLETISNQGSGEIERQFRRVVREVSMGLKFETALAGLLKRTKSQEIKLFIATIETQREVGGNLSQILENLSSTLRERLDASNSLKVLSADGRYSAWFLTALPIGVFLVFFFFNRSYVDFFWTEPQGLILALIFFALTIIGSIWIRLIVRVRF